MAIITNLQPPAGTAVAADTVLSFDVVDPVIEELRVFVWAVFKATGAVELVYDSAAFQTTYSFSSTEPAPGGRRFLIQRVGGWPSAPELRADTCACSPEVIANAGEANDGAQLGAGVHVFRDKAGVDLRFRSLLSSDASVSLVENSLDLDFSLAEAGGAAFNAITYTWPVADGAANSVLTTDGAGALTWEQHAVFPSTTTVLDNATTDITIGDVTTDTLVAVTVSVYIASLNAASSYRAMVVVDGLGAIAFDLEQLPSPTPATTMTAAILKSGNDINFRFGGGGAGASAKVTYLVTETFAQ